MQGALWTCQFPGCQTSAVQIAALRSRKPDGFPHDENPTLRVCTVCRRLPLSNHSAAEPPMEALDDAFIAGIKEDLGSIEESEKNIQALSQVFRYYARHARQLSQVLFGWAQQCFPWEHIHALHLVDDILLMDNSGRFKAEFAERVHIVALNTFRKAGSDQERREVVKMLHVWQELKIFSKEVLESIRAAIRSSGEKHAHLLDEASLAAEEEEEMPEMLGSESPPAEGAAEKVPVCEAFRQPAAPSLPKRPRVEQTGARPLPSATSQVATPAVASQAKAQKNIQGFVDRMLAADPKKPWQILGISEETASGQDIRKAYRRIALLVHPDKNPGMEASCQEALIKLQQAREQAESELSRFDLGADAMKGDTRSAATAAAAADLGTGGLTCRYPGCDLPPCKQCANQCCTRNITHCHAIARNGATTQCYFHPPPRAWARNA